MKKVLSLILTALLLAGCSTDKTKNSADEIISSAVDLENLQMEAVPGVVGSTIRHLTDITTFKTNEEVDYFVSAPSVCMSGGKTYLIRNFPDELIGADAFYSFIDTGEFFTEIEVYIGDDYSEPSEIIELTGFEDDNAKKTWSSIYRDESEDRFYLTGSVKVGEEYPGMLYIFDGHGSLISRQELSFNRLNPHLIHDGYIYVHHSGGEWGRKASLTAENIESGEEIRLTQNALTVFRGDDGVYCLSLEANEDYENEYVLFRYTGDLSQPVKIMTIPLETIGEGKINFAAYDSDAGALYWSEMNKIHVIYGGRDYSLLQTQSASSEILQLSGERLLLGVGCNQIAVYQAENKFDSLTDQQISIRVCTYGPGKAYFEGMFAAPLEKMNAAGMFVNFEYTYLTESDTEYVTTMAKKFLAGDTDFDLFLVETSMGELFDKNYYEDLWEYPVLAEYMDQALDGVKELCSIDGKLAVIPRLIQFNGMFHTTEQNASQKAMKYREFIDSAEKTGEAYHFAAPNILRMYDPWFTELSSNFMARIITDEQAESDLEMLYRDMLEVSNSDAFYFGSDFSDKSVMYKYRINGTSSNIAPLPTIGEDYRYAASGMFLGVNPNSENKDIAAAYMAYYLDMCTKNQLYQPDQYFVTSNQDNSALRDMLKSSIRAHKDSDLYYHADDTIGELLIGKITPEEAANRTYRYLRMMRDE